MIVKYDYVSTHRWVEAEKKEDVYCERCNMWMIYAVKNKDKPLISCEVEQARYTPVGKRK